MELTNFEINLLYYPTFPTSPDFGRFNAAILDGSYKDIIESFISNVFHSNPSFTENMFDTANIIQYLQSFIDKFIVNCADYNYSDHDVLSIGVACLYHFVQFNWTGPQEKNEVYLKYLLKCEDSSVNFIEVKHNIIDYLGTDDDTIASTTCEPILLLLAEMIFRSDLKLLSRNWWLMRSLYLHQLLLSDPSPLIHKELNSLIELLLEFKNESFLKIMFYLEAIQICLHLYSEVFKVQKWLDYVLDKLQLQVNLVGALGKRTRYQQRDIAQLTLKVESEENNLEIMNDKMVSIFPKDLRLDDDVRLPEINFLDEDIKKCITLNGIQQAAVLASFVLMKKSKPKDKLQVEELCPYLSFLLSQPKVWSLQMTALLFRSLLETEHSRTIERSITQIQSLISDIESLEPPVTERIPLLFCSYSVPKWKLEIDLAKLLVEVGAIQSALDIYLHLQMWEEIVACYNFLNLRHKAAEVIRQEMAKQETVKLWCLLGDATDDEKCYEKAWEKSQGRSSRAQKHWGLYYFRRKKYQEAIPHFQKSLELNSLQVPLWFNLGYAALDQENWEICASAYRRYTSLEPESFEAWNNLANAYIKLGQKDRAWRALQEAVKCNFDNWKVWDNLMVVSTDCADFEEVIRCYHRILELKGKHIDIEVLKILVEAIDRKLVHCDVEMLQKQTLKLFGRLTSIVLNEPEIWKLYADLIKTTENKTKEDYYKIIENLRKAHYVVVQEPNWERTVERCKTVIKWSLELAKARIYYHSLVQNNEGAEQLRSARMMLKNTIVKIKKSHTDALGELNSQLLGDMKNLENLLNDVENLLSIP